jgi:hypothetical protein
MADSDKHSKVKYCCKNIYNAGTSKAEVGGISISCNVCLRPETSNLMVSMTLKLDFLVQNTLFYFSKYF